LERRVFVRRKRRVKLSTVALALFIATLLLLFWAPFIAAAAGGDLTRFDYYVKALDYGLRGLTAYLQFIIDLFKAAVGIG